MSKWREDRIYEVMAHLNKNKALKTIYNKEFQKSQIYYPQTEYFERMEWCYNKAKQKYENL